MSLHSVEPTLRRVQQRDIAHTEGSWRGEFAVCAERSATPTTSEMQHRVEKDLEHVEKQSSALKDTASDLADAFLPLRRLLSVLTGGLSNPQQG
jgi:hypothetical protein